MNSLAPAELSSRLNEANPPMLLDVREVAEHEFVALPESTLIPLGELPERVDEIADWKDKEVVVYCHHGVRSLHAIAFLKAQGFQKVRNLTGGIDRWSLEVDPEAPRY